MKGQKKPDALKKLTGTAQKCRLNQNAVEVDNVILSPPAFLTMDAKKAFKELAELLFHLKVLTQLDNIALTMLCEAWGEWRKLKREIKKEGSTYETVNIQGNTLIKKNPKCELANDAFRRITNLLREFGLTPLSRAKVGVSEAQENDPFEEFLNEK